MELNFVDIAVFLAFIIGVVSLGMYKSRKEKSSEDYFLAGRGLSWWLIGFSLIAANISTEQFVGMTGNAASHVGLAIASYEWMAAITLVIVAFCFLPYFLRAGIFTMPEFLEYRYNAAARTLMAVATIFIYLLLLGSVTYSGAITIRTLADSMGYDVGLATGSLVIGLIAMLYVGFGGLKACAWADLIQGSALILGGGVIMYFAFHKLGLASEAAMVLDVNTGEVGMRQLQAGAGSISRFWELNQNRMNMFLAANDSVLPWTALMLGLWIPNFYYWGLNQYITQRTLGSASLAQGQKGIVFAAFMKLLIPFVIVVPGIIAFNLFSKDIRLDSVGDNTKVIAKYIQANPATKLVEKVKTPTPAAIATWPQGRYLVALYETEEAIQEVKTNNPYVLPLLIADFAELKPGPYTVFKSEDKAWKHVDKALALEMVAFNEKMESLAQGAGADTTTEKIIAYKYDTALGQLLGQVLPGRVGLIGFVLAALLGAVVSSLAAMLNAASTIFTMDVYKKYFAPQASQGKYVFVGRICVVVFTAVAIFLSPLLGNPNISNSIFTIIQAGQGFVSPGILAVFAFGLLVRRAPAMAGVIGLLTNIVGYGVIWMLFPEVQFLNRMAYCFGLCLLVMTLLRLIKPLPEPVQFKAKTEIALESSTGARNIGILVIVITLVLYFIFSPWGLID